MMTFSRFFKVLEEDLEILLYNSFLEKTKRGYYSLRSLKRQNCGMNRRAILRTHSHLKVSNDNSVILLKCEV